jgi:hypothetical protein
MIRNDDFVTISQELYNYVATCLDHELIPAGYYERKRMKSIKEEALKNGRMDNYQWEDFLHCADRRIDQFWLNGLTSALGYPLRCFYRKFGKSFAGGGDDDIELNDFIALAMDLTRIGFSLEDVVLDLVKTVRPELLKMRVVTDSEIRIIWFKQSQLHRKLYLRVQRRSDKVVDLDRERRKGRSERSERE